MYNWYDLQKNCVHLSHVSCSSSALSFSDRACQGISMSACSLQGKHHTYQPKIMMHLSGSSGVRLQYLSWTRCKHTKHMQLHLLWHVLHDSIIHLHPFICHHVVDFGFVFLTRHLLFESQPGSLQVGGIAWNSKSRIPSLQCSLLLVAEDVIGSWTHA